MRSGVGPNDRRETWQGFGDGLSQAVEMALVPALFALIGLYGLDHRLGTAPLFGVAFAVFAMVGVFVKAFYVYRYKMQQEDERRAWPRLP